MFYVMAVDALSHVWVNLSVDLILTRERSDVILIVKLLDILSVALPCDVVDLGRIMLAWVDGSFEGFVIVCEFGESEPINEVLPVFAQIFEFADIVGNILISILEEPVLGSEMTVGVFIRNVGDDTDEFIEAVFWCDAELGETVRHIFLMGVDQLVAVARVKPSERIADKGENVMLWIKLSHFGRGVK